MSTRHALAWGVAAVVLSFALGWPLASASPTRSSTGAAASTATRPVPAVAAHLAAGARLHSDQGRVDHRSGTARGGELFAVLVAAGTLGVVAGRGVARRGALRTEIDRRPSVATGRGPPVLVVA